MLAICHHNYLLSIYLSLQFFSPELAEGAATITISLLLILVLQFLCCLSLSNTHNMLLLWIINCYEYSYYDKMLMVLLLTPSYVFYK